MELSGSRQSPDSPRLWSCGSEMRSLPSAGMARPRHYYRPLRLPDRPGISLAGVRLSSRDSSNGVSRVASVLRLQACHRQYPGGTIGGEVAHGSQIQATKAAETDPAGPSMEKSIMARPIPPGRQLCNGGGLPLVSGGSAPAYDFSRPARRSPYITACLLVTPLTRRAFHEGFDGFVTSTAAPFATGCGATDAQGMTFID